MENFMALVSAVDKYGDRVGENMGVIAAELNDVG